MVCEHDHGGERPHETSLHEQTQYGGKKNTTDEDVQRVVDRRSPKRARAG
jgi:hypothetical protein